MDPHTIGVIVTALFVFCSIGVSIRLIVQHKRNFSNPPQQSKIIGILWMVPIYSLNSWLSIIWPNSALWVDMLRDLYESYVIYLFLALMMEYVGGNDKTRIVSSMATLPPLHHPPPLQWCFPKPLELNYSFIRKCKFATIQYSILKPACALLAIIFNAIDVYDPESFSLSSANIYLSLIMNCSVTYAFYYLVLFYIGLHTLLDPYSPVPKFICVKAVLFLSFWQGVVIKGLIQFHIIPDGSTYDSVVIGTGIQNWFDDWPWPLYNIQKQKRIIPLINEIPLCLSLYSLITFEMMCIAFAHTWAFPYDPYKDKEVVETSFLRDNFAGKDAMRDFNEVIPIIVLDTGFKPGKFVVTDMKDSPVRHPVDRKSQTSWHSLDENGEKEGWTL